MTPEEKLLALIQQDKRQTASVTPQEKLLELIEQDKRKPVSTVAVPPVVVAEPVVTPTPAPVKPVAAPIPVKQVPVSAPAPIKQPAVVAAVPVAPTPPEPIKKTPLVVVAPPSDPVKPQPVVTAPPAKPVPVVAAPKTEVAVTAPLPVVPSPAIAQPPGNSTPPQSVPAVPQPLLFPTIRVSGVTITNRVLAVMVMLLIVLVFYSVAGTQRGINDDIQRQISGAGEMSVTPLAIVDEPIPAVDFFVDKVSTRNFFVPKVTEKMKDGTDVPVTAGLTKDLKLVAVSMDAKTASESMAIIKSKVDSKTYFVKIGESVGDTGFVLTKVLTDRIVLKQRKQEFELK